MLSAATGPLITVARLSEREMANIPRDLKATGVHQKQTMLPATPEGEEKEECLESTCVYVWAVSYSEVCKKRRMKSINILT